MFGYSTTDEWPDRSADLNKTIITEIRNVTFQTLDNAGDEFFKRLLLQQLGGEHF